ncbi:MAG: GNAT family N-acetyltransferase [Pseudomonadota bacterium]
MSIAIAPMDDGAAREALCAKILAALPGWFGDAASREHYAAAARDQATFAALCEGEMVGIVCLAQHFATSFEVAVMGVLPAHHRAGHGRALVETAARFARAKGGRTLMVKTLGPSRPDRAYDATRAFYGAMGFLPLEEFSGVWRSPSNPCLVMVKPLG